MAAKMARDSVISFRISPERSESLDALAEATDRPKSWHLEQALAAYLETQSWQIAHMEKGLEQLRRGESVPHEAVAGWLSGWGTDDERDPPQ